MDKHLKNLRAFREEHAAKAILVSRDPNPRKTYDDISILPWKDFLEQLWTNRLFR